MARHPLHPPLLDDVPPQVKMQQLACLSERINAMQASERSLLSVFKMGLVLHCPVHVFPFESLIRSVTQVIGAHIDRKAKT